MAAVSQVRLWLAVKDSLTKYTHLPAGSSKKQRSAEIELVSGVISKILKCIFQSLSRLSFLLNFYDYNFYMYVY